MKKCFKFAKESSSSLGIVYRPIAKVGLKDASGEIFELSILVDSGADITILSKRIGDIMGINVEQGEAKNVPWDCGRDDSLRAQNPNFH